MRHIQEKGTENIAPMILKAMGMKPAKKEDA
jgi:hypothetical protein